jgi:membrane protease YdiL (CAAX protease family)
MTLKAYDVAWNYAQVLSDGGVVHINTNWGLVWLGLVVAPMFYYILNREDRRKLIATIDWPGQKRDFLNFSYFGFIFPPIVGAVFVLAVIGLDESYRSVYFHHLGQYMPVEAWSYSPILFFRDVCGLIMIAPVVEEVLFRFMLFEKLKGAVGPLGGAVISSILFSLCHQDISVGLNAGVLLIHFMSGLVLCWIYAYNGLLASISLHIGMNSSIILAYIILR